MGTAYRNEGRDVSSVVFVMQKPQRKNQPKEAPQWGIFCRFDTNKTCVYAPTRKKFYDTEEEAQVHLDYRAKILNWKEVQL